MKGPAKIALLLGIWLASISLASAQTDDSIKWTLNGYVKYLHTATYLPLNADLITGQLIHNRLNFRWYPTQHLTGVVELRNRLFYGEEVQLTPNYGDLIDRYDGLFDASVLWVDEEQAVLHTLVDRFYLEYAQPKWNLRAGRQRINWGVTNTWNPHDLFNAFNFLDFDYEERPGSDAIRLRYFPGPLSTAEIAVAPDTNLSRSVAAARYRFNVKSYDIQTLAGYYRGELAVGLGWAGYLGGAGFKGEGTYFIPTNNSTDSTNTLSLSLSMDYQIGTFYLNVGTYYNSRGGGGGNLLNPLVSTELSAKNLFPSRWSVLASASTQISPPWALSTSLIYATENNILIIFPTLSHSLSNSFDLDLIGQLFFLETPTNYQNLADAVYLRARYSF